MCRWIAPGSRASSRSLQARRQSGQIRVNVERLRRRNMPAPIDKPVPRSISEEGSGVDARFAVSVESGVVPKFNFTLDTVVAALIPVSVRTNVAVPWISGPWPITDALAEG